MEYNIINEWGDVKFTLPKEDEYNFYFMSDLHLDSPHCMLYKVKDHLAAAKEENARILIFGDLFDIIQGRNDPRAMKEDILPSLKTSAYFNKSVDFVEEILAPYKDNIIFVCYGNHELSIRKRYEIDVLLELQKRLGFVLGGYDGFILFNFPNRQDSSLGRRVKSLYYGHGVGGNSPMTMGVLNHKRMDIYIRDVDIIVTGHTHQSWYYEQWSMGISPRGVRRIQPIYHIHLPTYMQLTKKIGYYNQKMIPPPAIGCVKVKFYYIDGGRDLAVKFERVN